MFEEGNWRAIFAKARKAGFSKGFYLEQSEKPEEWVVYEHGEIPKLELKNCTSPTTNSKQ
jgi:hypothetical protein